MSWWNDNDWIDPDKWVMSGVEVVGTTQDMCWVINIETGDTGLFKPETQWRRSAYAEYAASKVAEELGVPSAKILVGELFEAGGCISMDVRKGFTDRVLSAGALGRCGGLYNRDKSRPGVPVYDNPRELSFQGLKPYLQPDAQENLIKMMFFDCVTRNGGRHESNLSFTVDGNRAISAMLPLYDHGWAIQDRGRGGGRGGGGRGGRGGGSSFAYVGQGGFRANIPFEDLYTYMRRDYPELIDGMMAKAQSDQFRKTTTKLECYDFLIDRINAFADLK
ncbi:MAG: hypothetical protein FWD45_01990 [Coriobacteriia bacterium]|nr:hypothetical protein [Coriobacteriia bacterium]